MSGKKGTGAGAGREDAAPTFEESLERLERIVEDLERGDLGLEDGLKLFEEGVSIANTLDKRLAAAEMKVEQLVASSGDEPAVRPLDVEDDA